MLDELEKDLEPFGEYYDLTEPTGDKFFGFFTEILFQKIVKWHYFVI